MSKKKHTSEAEAATRKKPMNTTKNDTYTSIVSQLESIDLKHAAQLRRASSRSLAQSRAARAQTDIQTELMECRILIQRALAFGTNDGSAENNDDDTSDVDQGELQNSLRDKIASSSDRLLVHLLEARRKLCRRNNDDEEDEEEDEEGSDNDMDYNDLTNESNDHQRIQSILQQEYERSKVRWKKVLDRRHADLRLHSGLAAKAGAKFKVVDQSFWEQVQSTLNHERLLQLSAQVHPSKSNDGADNTTSFDDSKVYQHMLQDFIAASASRQQGSSNAAEVAAERLRRAMRKKANSGTGANKADVDRRASKGRKIRYVVHDKLTNFMYPVRRPVAVIDEEVLFKSMFGRAAASRPLNVK